MTRQYLDAKEAAEYLGIAPRTLRAWLTDPMKARLLNPARITQKVVRFSKKNLDAFIDAHKDFQDIGNLSAVGNVSRPATWNDLRRPKKAMKGG